MRKRKESFQGCSKTGFETAMSSNGDNSDFELSVYRVVEG
jgi:hypothetical protein